MDAGIIQANYEPNTSSGGESMPLTRRGICGQILSSVETFRSTDLCSKNDCQVVVNHLIRKFSEPLRREGKQRQFSSKTATITGEPTVKDHLVPVKEIMAKILAWESMALSDTNVHKLDAFLVEMLVLVTITKDEDAQLNAAGLQQKMPGGYHDPEHEYFNDIWARYRAAGIYGNIDR